MAIWQFSVEFISKENLVKYFGEIPAVIDEETYWKEDLCGGIKLPKDYESFLNSLGEKEKLKWTQESYNWGDYDDGTHITIDLQDKSDITISARFHIEEWDEPFINTVLEFARMCDCVLITLNRTIFEPELDLFVAEFKKSGAYKFSKDPIGYLQSDELKQINEELKKRLADNEFNFNR